MRANILPIFVLAAAFSLAGCSHVSRTVPVANKTAPLPGKPDWATKELAPILGLPSAELRTHIEKLPESEVSIVRVTDRIALSRTRHRVGLKFSKDESLSAGLRTKRNKNGTRTSITEIYVKTSEKELRGVEINASVKLSSDGSILDEFVCVGTGKVDLDSDGRVIRRQYGGRTFLVMTVDENDWYVSRVFERTASGLWLPVKPDAYQKYANKHGFFVTIEGFEEIEAESKDPDAAKGKEAPPAKQPEWKPNPASPEIAALKKQFGKKTVNEAQKKVDVVAIAKKYRLKYPCFPPKHAHAEVVKMVEKELKGLSDREKKVKSQKIWFREGYIYRRKIKDWVPRTKILEELYVSALRKESSKIFWEEEERKRSQ